MYKYYTRERKKVMIKFVVSWTMKLFEHKNLKREIYLRENCPNYSMYGKVVLYISNMYYSAVQEEPPGKQGGNG